MIYAAKNLSDFKTINIPHLPGIKNIILKNIFSHLADSHSVFFDLRNCNAKSRMKNKFELKWPLINRKV